MKHMKKLLVLVVALALCLAAYATPSASADSGVKAEFGAFAAEAGNKLFMILPGSGVSSLYSMPAEGGVLTLIETAAQINDLLSDVNGNVYYLRYTGSVFQAIMRMSDGARSIVAEFAPGEIAHSLSLYNGKLYCLVNGRLMEIDLTLSTARQVSDRSMTTYTIADGIVYYESVDDVATYEMSSALTAGGNVTGQSGRLYGMMLDGSNDMQQFNQGVSALYAYGDYIYFHNLNDSYRVTSDTQEWLDGCLYRLNVNTNQTIKVLSEYDWSYRPTDYGLVVYREKALSLSDLSGDKSTEALIYEPDPYNYMAILKDSVIVYEYNLETPKLTRVPLNGAAPTVLVEGNFRRDSATGEIVTPATTMGGQTTTETTTPTEATTPVTGATTTTTTTTTPATTGAGTASTGTGASSSGYTAAGSMTIGATGDEVTKLQNRLIALGYLSGKADGVYGQKTAAAVRAFQRAAGLTVDGIAGKATINAINKDSAPRASSSGTDGSYIFPNSSSVKLTRSDVLSIDKSLWPYARNEIYARHGYVFDKKKYADYFATKSWYKAGGFKTSDLNSVEWYNMELIAGMEKEFENSSSSSGSSGSSSGSGSSGSSSGSSKLPAAAQAIGADQYIFPNSSTVKLTKSDIRSVDKSLWPYARNEIYARHGYKFTKETYKTYFGSKTWYKAGGFNTKDLNDIEWYNMNLIATMEANEK
ncbi:MAG: YARHG domain-containing protein [Clostridia bacterium]|nr:YARHG domain-containing protein [Clostridia bacterium]